MGRMAFWCAVFLIVQSCHGDLIQWSGNSKFVLELNGNQPCPGCSVHLMSYNGNENQVLFMDGSRIEINDRRQFCWDAGSINVTGYVTIQNCNGSATQSWNVPAYGTQATIAASNGQCLEVDQSIAEDGTAIFLADCDPKSSAQIFERVSTYVGPVPPGVLPSYPAKNGYCLAAGNELPSLDGCWTVEDALDLCNTYYNVQTNTGCKGFWYEISCGPGENKSHSVFWVNEGQGCCWNPYDTDRPYPISDKAIEQTGSAGRSLCQKQCESESSCGMFLYFANEKNGWCTTYPYKGECPHALKVGPTDCGSSGLNAETYYASTVPSSQMFNVQFKSQFDPVKQGQPGCSNSLSRSKFAVNEIESPRAVQMTFSFAMRHVLPKDDSTLPIKTMSVVDAANACQNDAACQGFTWDCESNGCFAHGSRWPASTTFGFSLEGADGYSVALTSNVFIKNSADAFTVKEIMV